MIRGNEVGGEIQSYRIRGRAWQVAPSGPASLRLCPGRPQALVSSQWETPSPLKEGQDGRGCGVRWGGRGSCPEQGGQRGFQLGLEPPPEPVLETLCADGLASLTRALDSGARGLSSWFTAGSCYLTPGRFSAHDCRSESGQRREPPRALTAPRTAVAVMACCCDSDMSDRQTR